ncbi:halocyanin domain-containing protein [Haloferacaceae archaeon DSL9]
MSDSQRPSMRRRQLLCATAGAAAAATVSTATTVPVAAQEDGYGDWFSDVPNYEGTYDYTGREEVTVAVGAGENGLVFEPAAILVDPGTTVVWEWTGEGGAHNVVDEGGAFESELLEAEGETFSVTFEDQFEDEGIYRYYCEPHLGSGMKGAVAVGDVAVGDTLIEQDGETDESAGAGGVLSTGEQLAVGAVLAALVSPLLFALLLKVVYEDDSEQSS